MARPLTRHRFDVEAIREAHPIAPEVASYGIELRPSGRAHLGRCPFHESSKLKLNVYPATNSWFCYVCGEGGDVVEFVSRIEHITFVEACKRLEARAAPPALPPAALAQPPSARRRWDCLTLAEQAVMNTACAIYQQSLWREPRARAYLAERGIPDWVIRQSGLGYADGHTLEDHLRTISGLDAAVELQLLRKLPNDGPGDSLRELLDGRIVVPELRGGQCIWFIGRSLAEAPNRPKYLALSGERPVLGFERAAGRWEVFLCEGVFDYLTAISWNLPAFSPCGTHLPAERLGFLARTRVVYGVLDGDEAGQAGAQRFAEQLGDRFRPIRLPEGSDLNDLGRCPGGKAEFFHLLAEARQATDKEMEDAG